MTKIAIVYYSMYGHVATMAEAVKKGKKNPLPLLKLRSSDMTTEHHDPHE